MSTDNIIGNKNNNRKKRNVERVIDPNLVKSLSSNFIQLVQKPSTKFPRARYICKICPAHLDDTDKAVKHSTDATHKNNVKRTNNVNMMRYLPEATVNQIESINECICATLTKDIYISEVEANRRKAVCEEMNEIACVNGGRLLLCGSLVTGLSMVNVSDVNLYFEISTKSETSYLSELIKLSLEFTNKLTMKTEIKQDKNNCGLFCKDNLGVSYHISDSTRLCYLTSQLLAVYAGIDERADKLIRLFRYFANQAFIDRNFDGLLPAQVLSLMVVFYLQQTSPPVLPNLHRLSGVSGGVTESYVSDMSTIRRLWRPPTNTSNVAQLWLGLLRFWSVDFNTHQYMVSVRAHEPVLKLQRNIINKRLAIEDPFDTTRNLLFGCNSFDVVDYINDQLHACYLYFAVAQLQHQAAFERVKYREVHTIEAMSPTSLVTPTFTKDEYATTVDMMRREFTSVYTVLSARYDTVKWPVALFVSTCLTTCLTAVFDSTADIDCFMSLLETKTDSKYFTITGCDHFTDRAIQLAMCVFREFSVYFEASGSWNRNEISSIDAFDVIKKATHKFRESSNEVGVYNEHRVASLQKEELEYNFAKIPIYKQKLEIVCRFCSGKGHRKENCREAIPRFDELRDVLCDVKDEWVEKLTAVLERKYENTKLAKESLTTYDEIFMKFEKIIKDLYPNSRPQRFGSSHSGFITRASDIDICIEFVVDDKRLRLSSKEVRTLLGKIGVHLKEFVPGIAISYILTAKVPIIKFYLKDQIQGDISINNTLALYNTKMLKLYSELYCHVKPLGNLVKFVSKCCDIGDASQGTLSSYAYIIMLIHFLQQRRLLPVLQELYEDNKRPTAIVDGWDTWYQSDSEIIKKLWQPKQNATSLGYLWLDFFYYYTVDFDMTRAVVSIKQMKPLLKIDKGWQMSYMAIEDPFLLNHNLGGCLTLENFRYITQCFAHVLKLHSNSNNLMRRDNAHNLLLDPSILKPPFVDSRSCFKCNKSGHFARDCTDAQYQQQPENNTESSTNCKRRKYEKKTELRK